MNILMIDDDMDDIELYLEIIQEVAPSASCRFINTCTNLETDLKAFGHQDFIFLDAHIPPMSVKECLGKIRNVVDTDKTRIIILTGGITKTEEHDLFGLGVAGVLSKGTSYEEIRSSLYHVISGDAQQFA